MSAEIHMAKSIKKRGIEQRLPLLLELPVNSHFIIGVYQGTISDNDMLIQYKQLLIDGSWSSQRTPKHIHWAVDILIKLNEKPDDTKKFLESLIKYWESLEPLSSSKERDEFLDAEKLMSAVNSESENYLSLARKGEYSIKFLILLAKLLMNQEKTNYSEAYMFRDLLEQLKEHKDIFKIISTATHH